MLLLLAMVITAAAQEKRKITGTVTDEKGEPLMGATIKIPNAQGGSVTDLDGNFEINVPEDTKQLTFSYIGFKTQTFTVKGNSITVVLKEDKNEPEMIVTQMCDAVHSYVNGAEQSDDLTMLAIKYKGGERKEERGEKDTGKQG